MNRKTIIIISVVLSVLLVGGAVGTGIVLAASRGSKATITKDLADKLNIKEEDVQSAFTELRQERQEEMQKKLEERLDAAVKDGKITEAQKETILKKHTAMQDKQEELANLRQDLMDWADDNDIDLREIMGGFGRGGGRGMGGPGGCFGPGPGSVE